MEEPAPDTPETKALKQHDSKIPRRKPLVIFLFILVLGSAITGTYEWQHSKLSSSSKQVTTLTAEIKSLSSGSKQVLADPTPSKPLNETVSTNLRLDYVPSTSPYDQQVPVSLSMAVPLILRTQITNEQCINGAQGGPAGGDSVLEECLHLSFADMLGSGDSLVNSGSMSLWDLHDWLGRNENTSTDPFPKFGLSTPAQKEQAWQALLAVTPSTNLSTVFKQLPSLVSDAAFIGGPQKLTYVQSADGNLKGVTFVATAAQQMAYDPYVWFMMGGVVSGQQVLITGSIKASDPTVMQIDKLNASSQTSNQAWQVTQQAADQLGAGKLSPQTAQAFSQVLLILKSIQLKAS